MITKRLQVARKQVTPDQASIYQAWFEGVQLGALDD